VTTPISNIPPIEELDAWLADRESRAGVKPGCEAGIVWAAGKSRTPVSVVYFHGYTASRGEMYPVADRMAAALGANLYYPRWSGHALREDGHGAVSLKDWQRDAREAWAIAQALGERVVILACSMGAALATWLILGPHRALPAASVLISPALKPLPPALEYLRFPGREWLRRRVIGETVAFQDPTPVVQRFWDFQHSSRSLVPLMELVGLVRGLRFQRWPTPALVVHDDNDSTVDQRPTVKYFGRSPRVRLAQWTEAAGDSNHVLAGDAVAPHGTDRMTELAVGFLKTALGS
jgi:esterase/lipase